MEASLQKKSAVLDKIREYNEGQHKIFSEGDVDIDKFDEYINKKDELIEQLSKLDDGFEVLYAKVADELNANRELYANQIKSMQQLIKEITDKSVSIQSQEAANKALIENYFRKRRIEIKDNRKTADAAYKYYRTFSNPNATSSGIVDSKK